MGNRDSILHKPFTIFWSEEEGHWGSSALRFLLLLLLFFCELLCSALFLCTSLSPLFWVSTRHQRPGISWLPVCQCRPWPWPAGWCCRCGNVVPPTGPGSQRLGSLWMQRNSCVCSGGAEKKSTEITVREQWDVFLLNQAMCTDQTRQSLICSTHNRVLRKPFQPVFYCATASRNSVNVKFYCVLYCSTQICCVGALSKKMIKGIRTQSSSWNCHQIQNL